MIRRCLNPRNPHNNASIPLPALTAADVSSALTLPRDGVQASREAESDKQPVSTAPEQEVLVEQVTCQFCKYLLEGAQLGDCRVARWIGSGTFGDVYEAEQLPPLSRKVAVKVMSIEHLADGQAEELFAREARTIAALDHPHILPVLRVGSIAGGRPYLVMKFAAHGSLQKFCPPTAPALSAFATALSPAPDSTVETALPPARDGGKEDIAAADTSSIVKDDVVDVGTSDLASDEIAEAETAHSIDSSVQDERDGENEEETTYKTTPLSDENVEAEQTSLPPAGNERDEEKPASAAPAASGEGRSLTPQQMLPYLETAAEALQYAHEHGIVHLDVKPANLLLDADDRLLLADFSVSALLEDYTHASLHGYVGTPLYTAPEQWLEQPRPASDQYALAVTCYQLLTGRPPFTGNLYSIMHGHIQTAPPPPRQFQPLIPAEIEVVILRALAKEPTARYKDVRAFAQAYSEALGVSASAQTDAHQQDHITGQLDEERQLALAGVETHALPRQDQEPPTLAQSGIVEVKTLSQSAVAAEDAEQIATTTGEKPHARGRNPLAIAGTLLLIALLLGGGILGTVRLTAPCLLGYCPTLRIAANDILLTNDSSQRVAMRNTGTAALDWSAASANQRATWLSFAPPRGSISPGQTGYLTISSHNDGMTDGTYTTELVISAPGIAAQTITVAMLVRTGLNAVSVRSNLTPFTFMQGVLQPAAQQITITNKSGQTLSWFISYSENTWLVVTPGQGTLATSKSTVLDVTANTQNLTPNTYEATLTILGKLPKQPNMSAIQLYNITLTVSQSAPTTTPTTQITPTAPSFQFPNFTAQPAPSNGAPSALRSGHSMVWDDRDNIMLVFGGIENTGALLNDLWAYSPASANWSELSAPTASAGCGSVPAPRMNAAMVWDSADQQVLLYGGSDTSGHYFGDLWSFSPASKTWTLIRCTGNGPGARAASAVWDGHEMLLVGGINRFGDQSDFWSYTPGSGQWQRLPNTPMSPRAYQTLVWDSTNSRLFVFGGLGANGVQLNDFWSYSAAGGWRQITPNSASNPLGRQQAVGAWDSRDSLLILMGGWEDGQGVPFWGFWVYDPKQNAWGLLLLNLVHTGAPHIPGRTAAAMIWDAVDGRVYIYAGAGNGKTGSSLNDLWMIS